MASLSYEKQFPLQYNRGWGSTLNLLNKYPAISKRIFAKFDYALEFINNTGDSAVEGLILTVVNDGDKNGAYLVNSIGTTENPSGGTLVKLGSSTDIIALDNKLNEHLSAYTE